MFATVQQKAESSRVYGAGELLIDLKGVSKQFEVGERKVAVLKGVNMQVKRGEFVALLGKSGSGKSTLLNMVAGLDRPSLGSIHIEGVALQDLSEAELSAWRAKAVGIVFQFYQLLPTLTALENVLLPMELNRVGTPRERHQRALSLLEQVELLDQVDQLPSALSGGQQQRVAIARALANDPPLIVADEPTGNLDSQSAEVVLQIFSRLIEQGRTILMVTHDAHVAGYASRIISLVDGQIVNEQSQN